MRVCVSSNDELVSWLRRVQAGELDEALVGAVWEAVALESDSRAVNSAKSFSKRYRIDFSSAHSMLVSNCFIYLKENLGLFLASDHPGWELAFANAQWATHHELTGTVNHREVPVVYTESLREDSDVILGKVSGPVIATYTDIPDLMGYKSLGERIVTALQDGGLSAGGALDAVELIWRTMIDLQCGSKTRYERGLTPLAWQRAGGKFRRALKKRAKALEQAADLIWELVMGEETHRDYALILGMRRAQRVNDLPPEQQLWARERLGALNALFVKSFQPALFEMLPNGAAPGSAQPGGRCVGNRKTGTEPSKSGKPNRAGRSRRRANRKTLIDQPALFDVVLDESGTDYCFRLRINNGEHKKSCSYSMRKEKY